DASAGTFALITDFIAADREVVDPLIAEDSGAYAAENNIAPRDCPEVVMAVMSKDEIIAEIRAMQSRLDELLTMLSEL
ncbi:MAG: hypothetical protein AAFR44_09380, partial [Pseudomonadota bacterium]